MSATDINKDNLYILFCMGAPCEKNANLIKNYDDFAELLRIHNIFSEVLQIPPDNMKLSMLVANEQSIKRLREVGDSVHVDFQGKHYETPITDQIKFTKFDSALDLIKYKLDSKSQIDLIIFLKDHGTDGKFGDNDTSFIDIVDTIENKIPAKNRKRTLMFIDACHSGSFSKLHESVKGFETLCNHDPNLEQSVSIFLHNIVMEINYGSQETIKQIIQRNRSEIVTEIKTPELIQKFNSITDDQFDSFLTNYSFISDYLLKIDTLQKFFSSPLWIFCSSAAESQTFSYPYRLFPRMTTKKSKNKPKKEENQKKEEIIKHFDGTPMNIDINDENIVFIQTGSFFMNAIISAIFQGKIIEKEDKEEKHLVKLTSDASYELFKKIIVEEMKRQELVFKESFFLKNYEEDLSKVTKIIDELSTVLKQLQGPLFLTLKQQIIDKLQERNDISQKIHSLKQQGSPNQQQIRLLREKANEIQKDIDLLSKQKENVLHNKNDKEKEQIKIFTQLIDQYTQSQKDLTTAIKDIRAFFENFESHQEKLFFSYSTDGVPFLNLSSLLLPGKSLIDIKPKEYVDINQYIYFNHRYAPLIKKRINKNDPINLRYLPSLEAFSFTFGIKLNEELSKNNYDLMLATKYPSEFDGPAQHFFYCFITNVENKFSRRHGCYVGQSCTAIKHYYQTHPEIPFKKLMKIMMNSVRAADQQWKEAYEREKEYEYETDEESE